MSMTMDPQMDSTHSDGIQPSHGPNFYLHAYADPSQDLIATSNHYSNSNHCPRRDQNTGGPAPVRVQAQTRFLISAASPLTNAGEDGSGDRDSSDPNHFPSQQLAPPTISWFKGYNKPMSVDPVTYKRSECCSQRYLQWAINFP